jgi:hypothetical protein
MLIIPIVFSSQCDLLRMVLYNNCNEHQRTSLFLTCEVSWAPDFQVWIVYRGITLCRHQKYVRDIVQPQLVLTTNE